MCIIRPYTYYGGKAKYIRKIHDCIPEHTNWYEPYMGSAVTTLNYVRSKGKEVINDMGVGPATFMKVCADEVQGKELISRLLELEPTKDIFKNAEKVMDENKEFNKSDMQLAVAQYVLVTMSYNSACKSFRNGMDTEEFRSNIRYHLPLVQKRLQGVEVKNMDALELLNQIKDDKEAFVFLDPPYLPTHRGKNADKIYPHEMSIEAHEEMLKILQITNNKVMLCGYRLDNGEVELYDKYLIPYGWKCYKLADTYKDSQFKKKKDKASEYIWVNYELPYIARFRISLKEYSSL